MIRRSALVALARVVNALFFLLTSAYCLLTYNSFAYQQFVRPHLIASLTGFTVWHGLLYWVVLLVTMLTLLPLPEGRVERWAISSYLAISGLVGIWLLTSRVLPEAENAGRSLVLAIAALVPPIWLAIVDHVATGAVRLKPDATFGQVHSGGSSNERRSVRLQPGDHDRRSIRLQPDGVDAELSPVDLHRVWKALLFTAALVWASYAAASPLRLQQAGDVALTSRDLLFGFTSSAVAHLTVSALAFLVLASTAGVASLTSSRGRCEYWLWTALFAVATAAAIVWLIFAPIAFRGLAAWAVAGVTGAMIALLWSSIARYRFADAPAPRLSSLDAWFAPIVTTRSRPALVAACCAIPALAYAATSRAALFDWNFMVQKAIALVVWVVGFGFVYAAVADASWGRGSASRTEPRPPAFRSTSPRGAGPSASERSRLWVPALWAFGLVGLFSTYTAATPRLPVWLGDPRFHPDFTLDGYAATDPAFRLLHDAFFTDPSRDEPFYALLRANTMVPASAAVQPADVNFVASLSPARGHKPHVFFFLIDSLRPDYLSAYNRAVTSTPSIGAFAREPGTFVFERAFTRYGGTGLSVPAIWAGGMILHKEYVTPFAPTNALEKLLDHNPYRRFVTADHITELFKPSPDTLALDRGVPEMQHTLCGTVRELEADIQKRGDDGLPIFAHTRPLELHVALVRDGTVPAGESYPGFYAPYATRVHRVDGCFGGFIRFLKTAGLYDDSIVILMADHGDSEGEGLRWGHAYTLVPEVIKIPLIIHLPPALRDRASAEVDRLAFSIDVTPTLYALLGYRPASLGPLFGESLFEVRDEGGRGSVQDAEPRPPDAEPRPQARRSASYLLASSYGAVYAILSQNGRKLYIADAINEREFAYDLDDTPLGKRVGVGDAERQADRELIVEQLRMLAAEYGFQPQP